jgi:geranylgeranyl diphosphate synthase, type I
MSVTRLDPTDPTLPAPTLQDLAPTPGLASLGEDFPTLLARVRPEIEARLTARWSAKLAALHRHGPAVVAMADAARELTLRGGKRFRAALLAAVHAGVAPEASLEPAYQTGVALELLQTYLLIQDDWIDGDLTRRGGPSVHAILGAALGERLGVTSAILASDFTWGMALATIAAIELPAPRVIEVIQLYLRIHEDVVIGQQIDVLGRAEDVEAMHDLKTGSYTVRGPIALGAALAGASPSARAALDRYAAPLGVAFQLRDDLLGTFGSPNETGKPTGSDLRTGKRTAILAEAEHRLDAAAREVLARAFGHEDASDADVAAATAVLEASGARAEVERRLASLCDDAEALAADLPLAPAAKQMLAGAARALRKGPE